MSLFDGLDALFLGVFGEDTRGIWTTAAGVAKPVKLIWDPEHTEYSVGEGVTVETTALAVHVSAADVVGISTRDTLSWQGVTHAITSARHDTQGGMSILMLQRQGR